MSEQFYLTKTIGRKLHFTRQFVLTSLFLVICCLLPSCAAPAPRVSRRPAHYHDQGWSEPSQRTQWAVTSGRLVPLAGAALARPARALTPSGRGPEERRGIFEVPDDGENFVGTTRAIAKTSPVAGSAAPISLATLLARLHHGPASDDNMRTDHDPKMKRSWDFDRVREERKNVAIDGWVLVANKEDDNDFHLIIATDPAAANERDPDGDKLLNVEISALPPDGATGRPVLVRARKSFKREFVPMVPDSRQRDYTSLEPVHVRITGSLFFDVDHKAGAVGPDPLRPTTSWEIHPVTEITVLQ